MTDTTHSLLVNDTTWVVVMYTGILAYYLTVFYTLHTNTNHGGVFVAVYVSAFTAATGWVLAYYYHNHNTLPSRTLSVVILTAGATLALLITTATTTAVLP